MPRKDWLDDGLIVGFCDEVFGGRKLVDEVSNVAPIEGINDGTPEEANGEFTVVLLLASHSKSQQSPRLREMYFTHPKTHSSKRSESID